MLTRQGARSQSASGSPGEDAGWQGPADMYLRHSRMNAERRATTAITDKFLELIRK